MNYMFKILYVLMFKAHLNQMLKHIHHSRGVCYFCHNLPNCPCLELIIQCQIILCFRSCSMQLCAIFLLTVFNISILYVKDGALVVRSNLSVSMCFKDASRPQQYSGTACLRAESGKMLIALKICSTWKHFCFPFLSFIYLLLLTLHTILFALLFLFSPYVSEVVKVCVYVNVYLHISPCGCMHQVVCVLN